ncbi:MAG: Photosynthesis system assembly factor [Frankiaceae bacterium]|nr:Photosynthesis system assembly factor [Frankiaceae bacterium]
MRSLLLTGAFVAGAITGNDGGPAAAASCGTRQGNWRTATAPAGLKTVAHNAVDMGAAYLAVDPLDSKRMYASPDARRIVRSLDGGCTWTTVFDLSSLPNQPGDSFYTRTASSYRIYQIVVPHGRAASDGRTVYALADMPPPGVGVTGDLINEFPILLAASTDGGSTWRVPTPPRTPSMPFGAPGCSSYFPQAWIAPAPGHPGTVYFFCPDDSYADLSVVPPIVKGWQALYRSTDGGASWSVRSQAALALNLNGGLGPMLDVDAHNPGVLYAGQAGYNAVRKGSTTQFVSSHDGGASFEKLFGADGWDPDNVGFTALTAASGPAHLATFGQAGLCISQDAGRHGTCWKPRLLDGDPGLITGAVWSATGDRLFVTVAYDEDWQSTGCGEQRAGVLTLKRLRWHDLGRLPIAAGANGVAITGLVADSRGNGPVMTAQPCVRTNQGGRWAKTSAPAVLLRYTAAWATAG